VRRYRSERRSPARATLLIVGGVIVAVAVIVAVVLSLGGSSKGSGSASSSASSSSPEVTTASTKRANSTTSTHASSPSAATAGNTNVAVLNGTGTTGLAHRVSGELRSQGYSKATALDGRPPGANQVTVVEYSSGHRSQAQSVAGSLGVSQAQPMEGTVASLAGSATVVVIVGLDKASTSP
jgi:cytoskeletal protein RodZ